MTGLSRGQQPRDDYRIPRWPRFPCALADVSGQTGRVWLAERSQHRGFVYLCATHHASASVESRVTNS